MTSHQHVEATASTPVRPQPNVDRQRQLDLLTRVNVDDLLLGLGLANLQRGRRLVTRLLWRRARHFAHRIVRYDDLVGSHDLATGGAWAVDQFVDQMEVVGRENLPRSGPVLIVANHPGLCDTTALFAAIDRSDLRIVAARRPFLEAIPHTERHLLYVDEAKENHTGLIRSVARHLRGGGALLTFPAGQIEPDPAVLSGAVASLERWSSSAAVFARFARGAVIVPAIVSGVLSPRAIHHPLTRIRRRTRDRQWLAGLLQIQFRLLQHATVRVAFGRPIQADRIDQITINAAVKNETRRLLDQVTRV